MTSTGFSIVTSHPVEGPTAGYSVSVSGSSVTSFKLIVRGDASSSGGDVACYAYSTGTMVGIAVSQGGARLASGPLMPGAPSSFSYIAALGMNATVHGDDESGTVTCGGGVAGLYGGEQPWSASLGTVTTTFNAPRGRLGISGASGMKVTRLTVTCTDEDPPP